MTVNPIVTVVITIVVNLLLLAYAIGKSQQKTAGENEKLREQLNGAGKKIGKVILYLEETAEGTQRQRLTDILK